MHTLHTKNKRTGGGSKRVECCSQNKKTEESWKENVTFLINKCGSLATSYFERSNENENQKIKWIYVRKILNKLQIPEKINTCFISPSDQWSILSSFSLSACVKDWSLSQLINSEGKPCFNVHMPRKKGGNTLFGYVYF